MRKTRRQESYEAQLQQIVGGPRHRSRRAYRAWRKTQQGIKLLRAARDAFKAAGSRQTLARVRKALTSAGGAERHAYGAYVRSWNDIPPGLR